MLNKRAHHQRVEPIITTIVKRMSVRRDRRPSNVHSSRGAFEDDSMRCGLKVVSREMIRKS
jgi:hypothetical protein